MSGRNIKMYRVFTSSIFGGVKMYDQLIDPPDDVRRECSTCVYFLCSNREREYIGFCLQEALAREPRWGRELYPDNDPCDEYEMI